MFQLGDILVAVVQVDFWCLAFLILQPFGEAVGDVAFQLGDGLEVYLLHTSHVGDAALGGHGAVGDDVRHALLAVFRCHPVKHAVASGIVEVNVDIGQRYSVGVEETFEQQVVAHRVEVGNPQAVGHHRACRRATTGTDADTQLLTCGADIVADDEEVSGETHGFYGVQLENNSLPNLVA